MWFGIALFMNAALFAYSKYSLGTSAADLLKFGLVQQLLYMAVYGYQYFVTKEIKIPQALVVQAIVAALSAYALVE